MPESRNKTIETIQRRPIQKIMLAAAVELDSSRISDYIKHRSLSAERVHKIEDAVKKIAFVWDTFQPYRIVLDSPKLLEQAFEEATFEHARRDKEKSEQVRIQLIQLTQEAEAGFVSLFGRAPTLELCTESGQGEK